MAVDAKDWSTAQYLILEDDVESVDDTWEVTEDGQEDIDPKVTVVGRMGQREIKATRVSTKLQLKKTIMLCRRVARHD